MSTLRRTCIPIYSGGCRFSQGDLVQVPFKKYLHGGRLNFSDWLLHLAFLVLDTRLPRAFEVGGSEGGASLGVGFARLLLSCQKLHWSPFEHCPFSFHCIQLHLVRPPLFNVGDAIRSDFVWNFVRSTCSLNGEVILLSCNWQLLAVHTQLLTHRTNKEVH